MSFPVVPLDTIPAGGLVVDVGAWASAACEAGLGGSGTAVSGRLEVRRSARHITVVGTLSGSATVPCDRCGEPLPLSVTGDVDYEYAPVDELSAKRAVDASPEEDADLPELGEYDGTALDLAHVVREFFVLERPPRVLCADSDPAADSACLARFKARAGAADDPPSDPRFAALAGVKPTR